MAGEVVHVDLEQYLIGWYRTVLAAREEPEVAGIEVDRVERDSNPLLVIRDDGGIDDRLLTAERQVGLTGLAGTRDAPHTALAIVRLAVALASRIPSPDPDNPVAAVIDSTGVVLVAEDSARARAYATVTLRIVGRPLT